MNYKFELRGKFPGGASAALTILDDADEGNTRNLEPLYDELHSLGFRITRSTWVLPPRRGRRDTGNLLDGAYVEWLKKIKGRGFEIALHNVGNGIYLRNEICSAIEIFKDVLGAYPNIQCNHHSNPDSVYWNYSERLAWPLNWIYPFFRRDKRKIYLGSTPGSPYFWADVLSSRIKYVRNLVFRDINTIKMDPYMPYWDPKRPLVPYWFSSTDMSNINIFSSLLTDKNLDRLCEEGGVCIGYTHLGYPDFVGSDGRPSCAFSKAIRLVKERDIWVAPVSEVLDFLMGQDDRYYDCELTWRKSLWLSMRWIINRSSYRLLDERVTK